MNAKKEKVQKWVRLTLTVSFAGHLIAGLALVAYSFWKVEKLTVKGAELTFFTPPPAPKPPAAKKIPPAQQKQLKTEQKIVKVKSTALVQPPKEPPKEPPKDVQYVTDDTAAADGGDEAADDGPVDDGGDDGGEEEEKEPEKKEEPPQQIAQQSVQGQMICCNNAMIDAPKAVLITATQQGLDKIKMKAKVCFGADGYFKSIQINKASGFPELDEKVRSEVAKWRYKPFSVNGRATSFCFPINFRWDIE
jgi:hypothetical protein